MVPVQDGDGGDVGYDGGDDDDDVSVLMISYGGGAS